MRKLLKGVDLINRANVLGVDIQGPPLTRSSSGHSPVADEATIQQRVIDAEKHLRESKLWLIAVVSAIASVLSACAAWIAVTKGS